MKFDITKGKKGAEDLVLLVCTDGYEQITYKDLFTIIKHFYDNEDKIYPRGEGSKFLMKSLVYLRTHSVEETLVKSQLKPPDKLVYFIEPAEKVCPYCGRRF